MTLPGCHRCREKATVTFLCAWSSGGLSPTSRKSKYQRPRVQRHDGFRHRDPQTLEMPHSYSAAVTAVRLTLTCYAALASNTGAGGSKLNRTMIDVEGGHQAWRTPDAGEAHGEKKKEGRAHNHSHAHGHVHSLARDLAAGHRTTAAASTARATTTEPTSNNAHVNSATTGTGTTKSRRMEFFRSVAETVTRDRMVTLGLVSGNSSGHAARTSLARTAGARRAGKGPDGVGLGGNEKKASLSISEPL